MTTRRALLISAVLAALAPLATSAAGYPEKPVTIVVPFPAGGGADAAMRAVQPRLAQELGTPLVIENVGGVGGALGAGRVAAASNDGYTLLAGSINDVVLVPVLNRNVRYKTRDFAPIGPIGSTTLLLVARKDLPADTIDAVIDQLRARPERFSYGSPGHGTFHHILMEDLQAQAGIRMVHVPYKGASPLVNDVLGGQVDLAVMVPSTALPHVQAGRLKALGVARLQRLPGQEHIPTLNEGRYLKDVDANGWFGLFAPKGIAAERLARLRSALSATLADKEVGAKLTTMGWQLITEAEQRGFAKRIERDEAKARSLDIKLP